MRALRKWTLLCLFYCSSIVQYSSCTTTYVDGVYRKVQNPELPSDYVTSATSTIEGILSNKRCVSDCMKETTCQSSVYDSLTTRCYMYSDALADIASANDSNEFRYTEDVCADSALNRPSYCADLPSDPMKDCQEYYENGITRPGVYTLKLDNYETTFEAWCDFDDSHGWTVIQRREDGSVNFYTTWAAYKAGFGNIDGEYWLGNDHLHALTQTNHKLNIFMKTWNDREGTANYTTFTVDDESNYYELTISGYSGTADDALAGGTGISNSGQQFSTHDVDRDSYGGGNCASDHRGGWWYNSCTHSNLNGDYCSGTSASATCSVWYGSWVSHSTALHNVVMRVTRD